MRIRYRLYVLLVLALTGASARSQTAAPVTAPVTVPPVTPSEKAMLNTLRPGHPRLIGLDADIRRAREMVEKDPLAKQWHEKLRAEADRMLDQPPVEHVLIGPRLLDKSRRALDRITTLAFLYRLDGDRKYAERARREMLQVAGFKDWNPSHFLDVAEMTHAVAIGYDWLYDFLSPEDRTTIRTAIVELGLKRAIPTYEKQNWWAAASHNWNQVCNGGMTIGALAVADEEPDLSAYILSHAVASVPRAMKSYAPDGGWAEGPGYWTYATDYNVYMLAALDTALGTDFGLSKAQGFEPTGTFRLAFEGPTGRTFNFADGGDRAGSAAVLFWLSRRFHRPLDAWTERRAVTNPGPYDLLWFSPEGKGPEADHIPLDAFYKGINVAFFRSSWTDPNAVFIGFKGGDNAANHSHLDLGTFVLDANGQRWAEDLGSDDYNMPGYFGKQRYTYYRLKTEGHNTLSFEGQNQETKAKAPIMAFSSTPARAFAVADLSAGYAGQAKVVRRGIALLGRRDVLVEDEVEADVPVQPLWAMHTAAAIEIHGGTATLRQHGKALYARILAPEGARFDTMLPDPSPIEKPNKGVTKLIVRLPEKVTSTRIAVLLSPVESAPAPEVTPLAEWKG